VLFATRKIITKTEDGGFGRDRTIAAGLGKDGGERVLRTVGSPACVAKNRYDLPAELPLSWPALMQALSHDPQPIAQPNLRLVTDQAAEQQGELIHGEPERIQCARSGTERRVRGQSPRASTWPPSPSRR
jgi:hypothetical protein